MRIVGLLVCVAACASGPQGGAGPADEAGDGKSDSASTGAAPPTAQAASTRRYEAGHVKWLLAKCGAKAIVCDGGAGKKIRIEKGMGSDDDTGLVIKGDYSYGTDEISQVFARDNLLVQWGEEGNYQLVISRFMWNLFGYEGGTPSCDAVETPGAVISEGETVDALTCNVEK